MDVTDENKDAWPLRPSLRPPHLEFRALQEEYVELMANWIMHKRVADERQALVRAFYEVTRHSRRLSRTQT